MESLTQGAKNVIGIGNDLVEVERIRVLFEKHKDQFLSRVFTEDEKKYCLSKSDPFPYLAARFAAKEAISKAFGTGIGNALGWKSISIVKGPREEPLVELDVKGQKLLKEKGGTRVLVSLSHLETVAQAIAVVIRDI